MLDPNSFEARFSSIVLYVWPLLFGIPQIVTGEGSRRVLVITMAVFITFMAIFARRLATAHATPASRKSLVLAISLLTLLVMNIVSTLRTPEEVIGEGRVLGLGLALAGMSVLLFFAFEDAENIELTRRRVTAFLLSPAIFTALNIILYFVIGRERLIPEELLSARVINYNQLLGSLGIVTPRLVVVPAIAGANSIGSVAALGIFAAYVVFDREWRNARRLIVLGAVAVLILLNTVTILLAESRAIIVWLALFIVAYRLMSLKWLTTAAKSLLAFSIVSPIVLMNFFNALGSTSAGSLISRTRDSGVDLGVGTGRPIIWKAALDRLEYFEVTQLIGYGHYGHFAAGVGNRLLWMFSGDLGSVQLHNVTLQNIYNIGYLGAALYIIAIWVSLNAIARTMVLPDELKRSLLVLLAFMTATGMTEPTTTIYQIIPFLFLIGLMTISWSIARYDGLALVWAEADEPPRPGAASDDGGQVLQPAIS